VARLRLSADLKSASSITKESNSTTVAYLSRPHLPRCELEVFCRRSHLEKCVDVAAQNVDEMYGHGAGTELRFKPADDFSRVPVDLVHKALLCHVLYEKKWCITDKACSTSQPPSIHVDSATSKTPHITGRSRQLTKFLFLANDSLQIMRVSASLVTPQLRMQHCPVRYHQKLLLDCYCTLCVRLSSALSWQSLDDHLANEPISSPHNCRHFTALGSRRSHSASRIFVKGLACGVG